MLFMHFPFHSEEKLLRGFLPTYSEKLNDLLVLEMINHNRSLIKPFEYIVNSALDNDPFSRYLDGSTKDISSTDFYLDDISLADSSPKIFPWRSDPQLIVPQQTVPQTDNFPKGINNWCTSCMYVHLLLLAYAPF